jgi:hypothetical protein
VKRAMNDIYAWVLRTLSGHTFQSKITQKTVKPRTQTFPCMLSYVAGENIYGFRKRSRHKRVQ